MKAPINLGLVGVSSVLFAGYLAVSAALAFAFSTHTTREGGVSVPNDAIPAGSKVAQGMDHSQHGMDHGAHGAGAGEHALHQQMMARKGYHLTTHDYPLPALELVDFQGNPTTLAQELDTHKPVLLNFIYTTCTTICPVLTATFSQIQQDLGSEILRVKMISITIDPEQDTPRQLREYAERFRAGPQWQFLTGDRDNIVAAQKAFDIYRGSKTNHEPITLLRAAGADTWIRIEGIAGAKDIVKEYYALAAVQE